MSWKMLKSIRSPKAHLSAINGNLVFSPRAKRADEHLLRRIVSAYLLATEAPLPAGGMWQGIFEQKQLDIHDVMLGGNIRAISRIFQNPGQNNLLFGIDPLTKVLTDGLGDATNVSSYVERCRDGLIRLCDALGATRVHNVEASAEKPYLGIEERLERIDRVLGFKLDFPNPFSREFGIQSSRGVVTWKGPDSVYQAWRCCRLAPAGNILEIGGGIGRAAYYAHRLHSNQYTIIDLPLSNAIQAYYIGLVVGQDKIRLFGEDEREDAPIHILPPQAFFASETSYDCIFNSNSITEMGADTIDQYWNHISKRTKVFLSINHEANPRRVWDIVGGVADRFPAWMRDGYVEEIVRF